MDLETRVLDCTGLKCGVLAVQTRKALEEGLKKDLAGVVDRVSDLEGKVDKIVQLLEE